MLQELRILALVTVSVYLISCAIQPPGGAKSDLNLKRTQIAQLRDEASKCYEVYDYECAASGYISTLEILEVYLSPTHVDIAVITNELAEVYRSNGQYKEAEALYLRALNIHESIPDKQPDELIKVLSNLGLLYKTLGRYSEALAFYEQVRVIQQDISQKNDLIIAVTLGNMASLHFDLGQYNQAKSLFEQALDLREKTLGQDHPDTATPLNNLASLHLRLGEYAEANLLYQRALTLSGIDTQCQQSLKTTTLLNNLAVIHASFGNYSKAQEQFQRVLNIRRNHLPDKHPDIADSLSNLAWVYQMLGEYTQSEAHYQQAQNIYQQVFGSRHIKVSYSLRSLAGLYLLTGDFGQAELHYQNALTIIEESVDPTHPEMAIILNDLALLYRILGDFGQAEKLFSQALETTESVLGPYHPDMALILNNMALLFYYQKDYARASPYIRRALAIQQRSFSDDHPDIAISLVTQGRILREEGDFAASQYLLERALTIQQQALGKNHASVAFTLNSLAKLHKLRGDSLSSTNQSDNEYAQAKHLYHRALALAIGSEQPEVLWRVQHNLSQLLAAQNNLNAAIFYGIEAVTTLQGLRKSASSLDNQLQQSFLQERFHVYRHLADLLISKGRIPAAQQVVSMLKEAEYFDFIRRAPEESIPDTPFDLRGVEYLNQYYSFRENLVVRGGDYYKFRNDLITQGAEQYKLVQTSDTDLEEEDPIIELDKMLANAQSQFLEYLAELESKLQDNESKPLPLPITEQKAISLMGVLADLEREFDQPGWVIIHTLITQNELHLILTTRHTQLVRFSKVKANDLYATITQFRNALNIKSGTDLSRIKELAKQLYDWILAPLAFDLQQANAQVLAMSLDGSLRYVPIAALFDGKKYIAEDFSVVMYTEAAELHFKSRPAKNWRVAGLGATEPPLSVNLPRLPAVKSELDGIVMQEDIQNDAGILPGVLYFDEDFTERRLTRLLDKEKYSVLHVAGHFSVKPGNMRNCKLFLGDGKPLSLEDIKLGRKHRFNFHKELVTLSACNTAVGGNIFDTGIEVESFASLAQKKGAESILATLWPVSDRSTGLLMQLFYDLREKQGLSKAEALRQAQIKLLHSDWPDNGEAVRRGVVIDYGSEEIERYRHPYFWAPFVLMGNGL